MGMIIHILSSKVEKGGTHTHTHTHTHTDMVVEYSDAVLCGRDGRMDREE